MHNQLLLKTFEKAAHDLKTNKPTQLAQHLSDYIREHSGEPYGEKSLRNHYTAVKKGDPIKLKKYVANALSSYLGFKNYETFVEAHPSATVKKNRFLKWYIWSLAGILIVIAVAFGHHRLTKERWMVWQEDHYREAPFDEALLQQGTLKLYKEDDILHFKKTYPNCETPYKDPDGSALLWYAINPDNRLEYFTAPGKHPETGQTLKELSTYMFEKHICPQ